MAFAPTPRFTNQSQQPVVIQNQVPKDQPTDVSGSIPGSQGNTFRLIPSQQSSNTGTGGTTLTFSNPYPSGYTSGIPSGLDTVSGPGASYQATNGQSNLPAGVRQTSTAVQTPGLISDTSPWRYIGPGGGTWAGQSQTGQPVYTAEQSRYTVPGGSSRMAYGSQPVGDAAMYSTGTTDKGGGNTNGGGSPQVVPPVSSGGGSSAGFGRPPGTPPYDPANLTPEQQARQKNMIGRVGFYHPGTGLPTAGTPYANPGYANPAGQWNPGYQAPSWLGGGYRGGGGGGTPPPPPGGGAGLPPFNPGGAPHGPGVPNPGLNPSTGGWMSDSGTGTSGGGGGGGWYGGPPPPPPRGPDIPSKKQKNPGFMYQGGGEESRTMAPQGGSTYLGPPVQTGGGMPPIPTFDPMNPPNPQQLLQMMRDWYTQYAAQFNGQPGPNFPGQVVPPGATVQSVYPPGAWERMQAIWPWSRRSPTQGGQPPVETDPYTPPGGEGIRNYPPSRPPGGTR